MTLFKPDKNKYLTAKAYIAWWKRLFVLCMILSSFAGVSPAASQLNQSNWINWLKSDQKEDWQKLKSLPQWPILLDKQGRSPLHWAVEQKNAEQISWLIAEKVPVNAKDNQGRTAAMLAAFRGDLSTFRDLHAAQADLQATDKQLKTAFIYAASEGHLQILQYIINQNVDPQHNDQQGRNALHWAVLTQQKHIYIDLVRWGLSPVLKDRSGLSAVDLAQFNGDLESAESLKEMALQAPQSQTVNTAKLASSQRSLANRYPRVTTAESTQPNTKAPLVVEGSEGDTPIALQFVQAAAAGDKEQVRSLLRQGVSPNTALRNGFTPLMAAAWQGRVEVIEELLAKQASLQVKDLKFGWNALMWASRYGQRESARKLLRAGTDPFQRDKYNWDAHTIAVMYHHFDTASLIQCYFNACAKALQALKSNS